MSVKSKLKTVFDTATGRKGARPAFTGGVAALSAGVAVTAVVVGAPLSVPPALVAMAISANATHTDVKKHDKDAGPSL